MHCVPASDSREAAPAPPGSPRERRDLLKRLRLLRKQPSGQVVRRFRCGCGCDGCICSGERLVRGDPGVELSIAELCRLVEEQLALPGWGCTTRAPSAAAEIAEIESASSQGVASEMAGDCMREIESAGRGTAHDSAASPTSTRGHSAAQRSASAHIRTPSSDIREMLSLEELLEGLMLPCPCEESRPRSHGISPIDPATVSEVSPGGTSSYA